MLRNRLIVVLFSFMQSNQWASMVLLDVVVAKVISFLEGKSSFSVSKFSYAICFGGSSLSAMEISLSVVDFSIAKFADELSSRILTSSLNE